MSRPNQNNNIGQPVDDLMSSTDSVEERLPENQPMHSDTPGFPGVAEGDAASSQSSTGMIQGYAYGSAGERNNNAAAFYGSREFVDDQPREGPEVERQAFDGQRPLHEMHIGTVSSRPQGLKELLTDLINAAHLSDAEKREISRMGFRKDKINKVIDLWKLKQPNPKKVDDLIQLLQTAGGPTNKYDDLIGQLRRCPP